jgi:hypothetical protein
MVGMAALAGCAHRCTIVEPTWLRSDIVALCKRHVMSKTNYRDAENYRETMGAKLPTFSNGVCGRRGQHKFWSSRGPLSDIIV